MAGVAMSFGNNSAGTGIVDLANAVIPSFKKDKVRQTQLLQRHPLIRRLILGAETMSGGIERTDIRLRDTNTARWVGLFDTMPGNRTDLMGKLSTEVRHIQEEMIFDEKEEAFTSGNETRIYHHLKQQYNGVIGKMWDSVERAGWGAPANSSDSLTLQGISFLMPGLAVAEESTVGTFNAQTARYGTTGTTTTVQGVDLSDALNANVRRAAATYSGEINEGAIETVTSLRTLTNFEFLSGFEETDDSGESFKAGGSFLAVPTYQYNQCIAYANKRFLQNADSEINMQTKEIMVDGMLIVHAPALDALTDQPMFAINTSEVYAKILADRSFKWNPATWLGGETWQKLCVLSGLIHVANPRVAGFRIHKKYAA